MATLDWKEWFAVLDTREVVAGFTREDVLAAIDEARDEAGDCHEDVRDTLSSIAR